MLGTDTMAVDMDMGILDTLADPIPMVTLTVDTVTTEARDQLELKLHKERLE